MEEGMVEMGKEGKSVGMVGVVKEIERVGGEYGGERK